MALRIHGLQRQRLVRVSSLRFHRYSFWCLCWYLRKVHVSRLWNLGVRCISYYFHTIFKKVFLKYTHSRLLLHSACETRIIILAFSSSHCYAGQCLCSPTNSDTCGMDRIGCKFQSLCESAVTVFCYNVQHSGFIIEFNIRRLSHFMALNKNTTSSRMETSKCSIEV